MIKTWLNNQYVMIKTVHSHYPPTIKDKWVWIGFIISAATITIGVYIDLNPLHIQRITLSIYVLLFGSRLASQIWLYPILKTLFLCVFYLYSKSFLSPFEKLILKETILRITLFGTIVTFIKYYWDFQQINCTNLKIKEKQLDSINQKLLNSPEILQSQKMDLLGHLAGGIAHDFNNTLGIIKPTIQNLKYKHNSANFQKELDIIEGATSQAENIVKQLLTFARNDLPKRETINIINFINHLKPLLQKVVNKNIYMNYIIPNDSLYILGNKTQLQQTVMNLIMNSQDALKETPSPKITIRLYNKQIINKPNNKTKDKFKSLITGNYAVIEISDNGIGIPNTNKNTIFDPFMTTKTIGQGTGLGLSVAQGIMDHHKGHILFESSPSIQTSFWLYFPITNSKKTSINNPIIKSNKHTSITTKPINILLVDDSKMILTVTSELLSQFGFQVTTAQDGLTAIELFKQKPFDFVILDYQMPEMGGIECFKQLQKINPKLFVFIYSGDLFSKELLTFIDSHKNNSLLLYKPLDLTILESHLLDKKIIAYPLSHYKLKKEKETDYTF